MHSTSGFSSRYACAASSRRISIRLGRVPRTLQPNTTMVSGAVGFVQIVRTICTDITAEKVSPAASRIPYRGQPDLAAQRFPAPLHDMGKFPRKYGHEQQKQAHQNAGEITRIADSLTDRKYKENSNTSSGSKSR